MPVLIVVGVVLLSVFVGAELKNSNSSTPVINVVDTQKGESK